MSEIGATIERLISDLKRLMKELSLGKTLNDLNERDFEDWVCCRDALKHFEKRLEKTRES